MKKIFKFTQRFGFSNWSKGSQRDLFKTNLFLGAKTKQIKEEIVEKAQKKKNLKKNVKEENEKDEEKDKEGSEERKKDEKETIERKVTISKEDSLSQNSSDEGILVVENINKWNDKSTLKEIIKDTIEFDENEKDQLIEILQKNFMKTLGQWKPLTAEQKQKYPDGLKNILDNVSGKK
jgi:hypothetical protein